MCQDSSNTLKYFSNVLHVNVELGMFVFVLFSFEFFQIFFGKMKPLSFGIT